MGRVTKSLMGLSLWLTLRPGSDGGGNSPSDKLGLLQCQLIALTGGQRHLQGKLELLASDLPVLATPAHLAEEGLAYTCWVRKSWSNFLQQIV